MRMIICQFSVQLRNKATDFMVSYSPFFPSQARKLVRKYNELAKFSHANSDVNLHTLNGIRYEKYVSGS